MGAPGEAGQRLAKPCAVSSVSGVLNPHRISGASKRPSKQERSGFGGALACGDCKFTDRAKKKLERASNTSERMSSIQFPRTIQKTNKV